MRTVEILKRTGPTTLTKQWLEDGTVVEPSVVTFDLIGSDGVSIRTGTATKAGTAETTTFTVAITVAEAVAVEAYRLVWTRSDTGASLTDGVEIVGSLLFTEAEARGFKIVGGLNPLTDAEYSDQAIAEARYRIAELLERRLGVSPIRKFARIREAGTGRRELSLRLAERRSGGSGYRRRPREILAASVNGTALSSGELGFVEVDSGRHKFTRYDGNVWDRPIGNQPPRNVVVAYEYGIDEVSWEANRVALVLLLKAIVPSDVTSRATSFSNPDGTFRLSMPSLFSPTGIPEVDEYLSAYEDRALFA